MNFWLLSLLPCVLYRQATNHEQYWLIHLLGCICALNFLAAFLLQGQANLTKTNTPVLPEVPCKQKPDGDEDGRLGPFNGN